MSGEKAGELVAWPDGSTFFGELGKDGRPEGFGAYTWRDGQRFAGEFRDGERHGHGVTTYPDGTRHEGGWHEGAWHGRGIVTEADGSRIKGEFWHGKPVGAAGEPGATC